MILPSLPLFFYKQVVHKGEPRIVVLVLCRKETGFPWGYEFYRDSHLPTTTDIELARDFDNIYEAEECIVKLVDEVQKHWYINIE